MFGDHWAEFDVGGFAFGIGNGEPLGITRGTSVSATFEVDDIKAERQRLLDLGVPVTEIMNSPLCFSDPEGNKFGIHERKPQADDRAGGSQGIRRVSRARCHRRATADKSRDADEAGQHLTFRWKADTSRG